MPLDAVRPLNFGSQPSARSLVVVCEREPYWTPELQRQFYAAGIPVRGCRKLPDMAEMSATASQVVQIVDLASGVTECLTYLARSQRVRPRRPLIVIASPDYAEFEWVLREAGVQVFYADHPTGADLARNCRRWLPMP